MNPFKVFSNDIVDIENADVVEYVNTTETKELTHDQPKSLAIADSETDKIERVKNIAIDNAISAITKNQQVIDEFARFVLETDDPRAYDIFSRMMVNTATLSEKLMNTVKVETVKNEPVQQTQNNIQNNYILSPSEVIKQIRQSKEGAT